MDDSIYKAMIESGWTRVSVDNISAQFMLHIQNLKNVPMSAISFIEKNFDPNDAKPIEIVSHNGSTEITNPFPDVQRAVR